MSGMVNLNGKAWHDASANATPEATLLADENSNPDFGARHGTQTSFVVL